jgi:hypothetical protein
MGAESVLMNVGELANLLFKGHVIGVPLNAFRLLEKLKDECYPKMGPIGISIHLDQELFLLQRDVNLPEKLWY